MSKDKLAAKVSSVLGYGRDFATSMVDTITDADVARLCSTEIVFPNDLLNAFHGKEREAKALAEAAEANMAETNSK